jgi:malonate decarboxylase beta subunit
MRAIVQARCAGVAVIPLVGGRAGAFGGAGLTTATCSRVAVSEQGRIAVSGPEVIETNKGVEEFDAENKALMAKLPAFDLKAMQAEQERLMAR